MPVNLSIKNVSDELAQALRERARRHHRSLQGELLVLLEEGVAKETGSLRSVFDELRSGGLATRREAAKLIREDRDRPRRR